MLSHVVTTLGAVGLSTPQSIGTALRTALVPLAVTASLFLGPLYTAWLDGRLRRREDVRSLIGFRNVVAVSHIQPSS